MTKIKRLANQKAKELLSNHGQQLALQVARENKHAWRHFKNEVDSLMWQQVVEILK